MRYEATVDNVGDWGGEEDAAVNCWNNLISPVLGDIEQAHGEDVVKQAQQWAWDEFCRREANTSGRAGTLAVDLTTKYLN